METPDTRISNAQLASQPVEATPETWRDLVAAMVDAHEFMAPGPFSPPEDWVRMPWKRWEAIDRFARSLERQLSLAQTENAGHIRIEDELKAELREAEARVETLLAAAKYGQDQAAQAQERCAELEKAVLGECEECGHTIISPLHHLNPTAAHPKPSSR